jgi:purine nucleosidase
MKFELFFVLFLFLMVGQNLKAQKVKLIIDADTGNEMDDLYAITRTFDSQDAELLGLISAHFNNPQLVTDSMWNSYPTKNINTVRLSQMENERLLHECNHMQIPHPQGCEKMVGFPWGFNHGMSVSTSAGVDFIISKAKKASPENKLIIACLGPVTNVAAAILTDSTMAKNIRLYILSMRYNPATGIWNKNEFNARNDLNALDIILNCTGLELIIMSSQVSGKLIFKRKETQSRLAGYPAEISKNLSARWDVVRAGETWIMWDLALIESILHPELATLGKATTPPENVQRSIHVFTDINVVKIKADFWKSYQRLMQKILR